MNDPAQLPLRDIHLPEPVSWWPPAPGWWLLAGAVLALTIGYHYWRRRRERIRWSAINLAHEELTQIQQSFRARQEPSQAVRALSVLLRRVCISLYPREQTAGLTGEAWLEFLNRSLPEKLFTEGHGRLIADAPYRPDVKTEDVEQLLTLCHKWIDALSAKRTVTDK